MQIIVFGLHPLNLSALRANEAGGLGTQPSNRLLNLPRRHSNFVIEPMSELIRALGILAHNIYCNLTKRSPYGHTSLGERIIEATELRPPQRRGYPVVSARERGPRQACPELGAPVSAEQYGALRDEVLESLDKFLECGILKHGCGRAHCTNPACNHSELIPFSCKQRCLCPSCDAKRAVLFAEKLEHEVLLKLPHQHAVFTIPKRVRPYFRFDRSNISILYQASWQAWQS